MTPERKQYIYRKFQQYLKDNIDRDRYLYVGVKPTDDKLHLTSTTKENCDWLHETLGYFFQGVEIAYYTVNTDGAIDR